MVPPFERASRVDFILEAIKGSGLGDICAPKAFSLEYVLAVHDPNFVEFLSTVWEDWQATGYQGEAVPNVWPARRMQQRVPSFIEGKLGYYAMAAETSISAGTWTAALAAKDVALTGAQHLLQGETGVFSLCRPPGHHAAKDMFGGYCFLNNAAIAAQYLVEQSNQRVAVLDIDFHHGNGTQDIFYNRNDVLFCSLHGEPEEAFPHFLGYADETGSGAGLGFNCNYPLPRGTSFHDWYQSLEQALDKITAFAPTFLVVSLGVDTFENDPISFFQLTSADFSRVGQRLGDTGLPTLFVMEGGYDVAEVGTNVVNVLREFARGV